jgi:hypothetical protein
MAERLRERSASVVVDIFASSMRRSASESIMRSLSGAGRPLAALMDAGMMSERACRRDDTDFVALVWMLSSVQREPAKRGCSCSSWIKRGVGRLAEVVR